MVHSMADSKASGFSKVVQKHSLRAKERVSYRLIYYSSLFSHSFIDRLIDHLLLLHIFFHFILFNFISTLVSASATINWIYVHVDTET